MKRHTIILAVCLSLLLSGTAGATSSYMLFEEYGGSAYDVEKSDENPDDDWLCWAAVSANILKWGGWATSVADSAQSIFQEFGTHWTNASGMMGDAWNWWLDGTEPDRPSGWAEVQMSGGGNHWEEYSFADYFQEAWVEYSSGQWGNGSWFMETLNSYLRDGYGTALAVYSGLQGHALTGWGIEYDQTGGYSGVWVTDSDDAGTSLKLLSVELDETEQVWYLDSNNVYDYQGYILGGMQVFGQRPTESHPPVPEPSVLLLLGSGLIGLFSLTRHRTQR